MKKGSKNHKNMKHWFAAKNVQHHTSEMERQIRNIKDLLTFSPSSENDTNFMQCRTYVSYFRQELAQFLKIY